MTPTDHAPGGRDRAGRATSEMIAAARAFYDYGATRGNHGGHNGVESLPGPLTPHIHAMGALVAMLAAPAECAAVERCASVTGGGRYRCAFDAGHDGLHRAAGVHNTWSDDRPAPDAAAGVTDEEVRAALVLYRSEMTRCGSGAPAMRAVLERVADRHRAAPAGEGVET